MIAIENPEMLRLAGQPPAWGADQAWYPDGWQRKAGCGPATCANLLWHLAGSRAAYGALCPCAAGGRADDMLALMQALWHYVTPTAMGVNTLDILADGARRFAGERGLEVGAVTLPVPKSPELRPAWEAVAAFLAEAFGGDRPVAFLNLSNGKLTNLESWHWVTLIAVDPACGTATMLDQGRRVEIDLRLWLETSYRGGGFVWLK